jgi:excisionase family DNA binding protein
MSLVKLLYRPEEVAEILSISKSKVYSLIKDGELIAHCENGAGSKPVKVVSDSIAEYVKRHKVPPEEWQK